MSVNTHQHARLMNHDHCIVCIVHLCELALLLIKVECAQI